MTLSFTGAGTAVAASGASPQAVTTATAFAVGDMLVALIAYDNSGTNGADPMSGTISVAPATGAVGASVSAQTGLNDPSTASAGLAVRCVAFPVTTAIPSGTVCNVSWSGTIVVRAAVFGKVTASTGPLAYRTNSGATGTNGVGVTTVALTTPSVTNAEMVLCWAGHENGAAITGDADTTNGSWSAVYGNFTGTTTSGIAAYFQNKVVTATATQAFNPTGASSDWVVGCLIFREGAPQALASTVAGTSTAAGALTVTPPAGGGSLSYTTKYSAVAASSGGGANNDTTVDCGTVTTGALLTILVGGTCNQGGAPFTNPSKASGTATIGTVTSIGVANSSNGDKAAAQAWQCVVTAGGTLVLNIQDAVLTYGFGATVLQWTGQDATTPVVGAVVTMGETAGNFSPTTATLTATPASGDYTVAFANWDTDPGSKAASAGSGFTAIGTVVGTGSDFVEMLSQQRTGSTSTTVTWPTQGGPTTYSKGGVAFIVKAAPATATVWSDDFNRADEALDAGPYTIYTQYGSLPGLGVVSNQVTPNLNFQGAIAIRNNVAATTNQQFVKVTSTDMSQDLALTIFQTDTPTNRDGISIEWHNYGQIFWYVNGAFSGNPTVANPATGSHVCELNYDGTDAHWVVDGTVYATITPATMTSTGRSRQGFGSPSNSNCVIDDASGGQIGGSSGGGGGAVALAGSSAGTSTSSATLSGGAIATPIVVATTYTAVGPSTTNVAKPAGGQTGDYYVIYYNSETQTTVTFPGFTADPNGYVTLPNSQGGQWFWKAYDGSEGSTFANTGGNGGKWTGYLCFLVRGLPGGWVPYIPPSVGVQGANPLVYPAVGVPSNTLMLTAYKDWNASGYTPAGSWTAQTPINISLSGYSQTFVSAGTAGPFTVAPSTSPSNTQNMGAQLFSAATMVYADDFNRGNAALGSPWVAFDGGLVVASNKAAAPDGNLHTSRYNQPIAADHWAEADLTNFNVAGSIIGPCVRFTAGGDFYYTWINGSNINITKRVGGIYTSVATGTAVGSAFKCRFEAQGSTLRMYVNGTLAITTTDTSISTGQPGILAANGAGSALDNWRSGPLPYTPIGAAVALAGSSAGVATTTGTLTAGAGGGPVALAASSAGVATTSAALSVARQNFADNFNRVGPALGSDWIALGGVASESISGNKAIAAANVDTASAVAGMTNPVQLVSATFALGADYAEGGVLAHAHDGGTAILAVYSTDGTHPDFPGFGTVDGPAYQLYYGVANAFSMLSDVAAPNATAPRRVALAVNGNALQGWFDGVLKLTGTEGSVVGRNANPGFTTHHATTVSSADDFLAQTFTTAPAAPTITSFSLSSAAVGATVTVIGTGFYTDFTEIAIGGVHVPVTVTSLTTGTFVVPAASGTTATLTTPFGTDSRAFTVLTNIPSLGNTTEAVGTTSLVLTKPTGYTGAANQQLFLCVFTASTTPPDIPVAPAGFTQVGTPAISNTLSGFGIVCYTTWFRSTTDVSASSTYTVTFSGNTVVSRGICGVINNTSGPINPTYSDAASVTSLALPGLTTAVDNSLVLGFATADEPNTFTVPSGYTAATVEGTSYVYFDSWQSLKATAGAISTPTTTINGTTSGMFLSSIAYAPAGGPVALAGSSAGVSTATGTLAVARALVGGSTGSGTAAGSTVIRTLALAGSSAGTSTVSGDLTRTSATGIFGNSDGHATASGSLSFNWALAATIGGTSTASATQLALARPLGTASAAGTSTASGTLTTTSGLGISGAAAGTSTAVGSLSVNFAVAASSAGLSTAAATLLAVARPLAGRADGVGTSSGDLTVSHTLVSSSAGVSTAAGTLIVAHSLIGSSAGVSTASAVMVVSGAGGMAAVSMGTSTASGSLSVAVSLAGRADGSSTASGALAKAIPMAGSSAGLSTASATGLSRIVLLAASSAGSSTAAATALPVARALTGQADGLSTVVAGLAMARALVALSNGASTATGTLRVARSLAGTSNGHSTASGTLQVIFIAPVYGIWNGMVFDAMQYGDKQVTAFLMSPT